MKFNSEIIKHIEGKSFSAGLDIDFSSEKYNDQSRIEKIVEMCKNKKVLHMGCADHLPLIDEKIKNNKWLHKLLIENTLECIGIDNNKNAVKYITDQLGIKNVYCLDITNEDFNLSIDSKWDYLILGEIIEHVDNPVLFLQNTHEKFKDKVSKIIITAPNNYNLLTINDIKQNKENINTDHRYWFSPFTLAKIVSNSGFCNYEISFAERIKLPVLKAIQNRIKRLLHIKNKFRANCFYSIILTADFE